MPSCRSKNIFLRFSSLLSAQMDLSGHRKAILGVHTFPYIITTPVFYLLSQKRRSSKLLIKIIKSSAKWEEIFFYFVENRQLLWCDKMKHMWKWTHTRPMTSCTKTWKIWVFFHVYYSYSVFLFVCRKFCHLLIRINGQIYSFKIPITIKSIWVFPVTKKMVIVLEKYAFSNCYHRYTV